MKLLIVLVSNRCYAFIVRSYYTLNCVITIEVALPRRDLDNIIDFFKCQLLTEFLRTCTLLPETVKLAREENELHWISLRLLIARFASYKIEKLNLTDLNC